MQMEERQFYHRERNKIWGALQDGKAATVCVCESVRVSQVLVKVVSPHFGAQFFPLEFNHQFV